MYYSFFTIQSSVKFHKNYVKLEIKTMVIIKFALRGSKYTWFMDDNWVMILAFVVTLVAGVIFRKIKKLNSNDTTTKMTNPRGGTFIDDCIELDSVYEVVNAHLEIVTKRMLKLSLSDGPIIISTPLLILAYIVSRQPGYIGFNEIMALKWAYFLMKMKDKIILVGNVI